MMSSASPAAPAARGSAAPKPVSGLYRAVWRWHFYAGLLVLPFLISLSITGGIYLFREEVDALVHDFITVEPQGEPIAPSTMIAAALEAQPGTAIKFTDPYADTISAEITIQSEGGPRMAVFVDPYRGEVLEVRQDRSTFAWTVRYLHSFRLLGASPRLIIEIAAGFSILLVATGIYLWWPRGQKGGVVTVRATPARRVFWRDLHAVTGVFVGAVIVFLAVTGMPWSSVWGAKVNEWANGSNFGYPSGLRINVPMSGEHLDHVAKTSWSLEQAQIPESQIPDHADHAGHGGDHADHGAAPASQGQDSVAYRAEPVGIDTAVAALRSLGLHRGFSVALPGKPEGVYSGSVYPDDLSRQRVVHLDQYSGLPLLDMSYADYGPLGRGIEWGVNTHLGQTYGLANKLFLLLACAATVLLCVSAAVMWWKRRPSGSLGVPPLPSDRRVFVGLFVLLGIGGALFPLTGITLIVMIVLDLGWQWISGRGQAAAA